MVPAADTQWSNLCIVGYGNPQRRDDGTGCYVAESLGRLLEGRKEISIRALHQLDPVIAEELKAAEALIFVDATAEEVAGGSAWGVVRPQLDALPYVTHHVKPSYLLALLKHLYRKCPKTWLVSVQGDDFGFGEGLSPECEVRAKRAALEIASFVSRKMVDKG